MNVHRVFIMVTTKAVGAEAVNNICQKHCFVFIPHCLRHNAQTTFTRQTSLPVVNKCSLLETLCCQEQQVFVQHYHAWVGFVMSTTPVCLKYHPLLSKASRLDICLIAVGFCFGWGYCCGCTGRLSTPYPLVAISHIHVWVCSHDISF